MSQKHSDFGEEPFIDSLRERIEHTKAENARLRAAAPAPLREAQPPSEDDIRALRRTRALEIIGETPRAMRGAWPLVLLIVVLIGLVVVAVQLKWLAAPVG